MRALDLTRRHVRGILAMALVAPAIASAQTQALNLPIGDPTRKDREAPLVVDVITETASGDPLTPAGLAGRLATTKLLFVGESHTSMEFHRIQLRVVEELRKHGRQVLIGLEMYPYTEQPYLDQWVDGALTEEGFLRLSHWYKNWSHHWNYYRDIFLLAREHRVRMFAINTPREVVTAVRKKGFQNLTPEEAAHIPPRIDTDNAEHRRLFRAFFEEGDPLHAAMSEEQWEGMFRAQCTWDATMAFNAVQALKGHGGENAIMVVLIGAGHAAYGLGAERQAALWFDGRMASLIPVPVRDEKGARPAVRASYATFIWGIPPEPEPLYPTLGASTRAGSGPDWSEVIGVSKNSVAAAAGFQVGDRLVSMNGVPIRDPEDLNRAIAARRWGDSATFEVRRAGALVSLTVHFRRRPPA